MTIYQQKAKEIIDEFYLCMPCKDAKFTTNEDYRLVVKMEMLSAKQCAMISVDNIIRSRPLSPIVLSDDGSIIESGNYWIEVKFAVDNYKVI